MNLLSFAMRSQVNEFLRYLETHEISQSELDHTLRFCGSYRNVEIIRALLRSGANPNIQDPQYMDTALIRASTYGHTAIVQLLLESGANPNLVHSSGRTALMFAIGSGNLEIAQLLVDAGANVNIVDRRGRRPIDVVRFERQRAQVENILNIH
jgi:ankyrin repeat protein